MPPGAAHNILLCIVMLIKAGWWAVLFACLLMPGTYFLFVCAYIFFCLYVFFDCNYDCCVCIYGGDVFLWRLWCGLRIYLY